MKKKKNFWEVKTLKELSAQEWEALCDGCGKCCLEKVIFEEDETLAFTNIACKLLDLKTCRCRRYNIRHKYVSECVQLRPENMDDYYWLPKTCAYRLLHEGKALPKWHPLITGNPMSVHEVGVSAAGRCIPPQPEESFQEHIVDWDDL